jgi:hypothetical protein
MEMETGIRPPLLMSYMQQPAPGSAPYAFASVYARSTAWQLTALLGRTWTMYWRDGESSGARAGSRLHARRRHRLRAAALCPLW